MTLVADTGLWNIAREQPDLTAVVDPERTRDQLRRPRRRRRPLRPRPAGARPRASATCVVVMLPNSIELVALYFAALECGLYIVPINWHLTGPEVAYIVEDSEAKVFVGHERFAEAATVAAAALPDRGTLRGRRRSPASGRSPNSRAADGRPDNRTHGAPMVYTSGTTGKPKGVKRPLTGHEPGRRAARVVRRSSSIFGITPFDEQRAHLRVAALSHGGAQLRRHLDPARPHRGADGALRRRGDAAPDRAAPGHAQPHGADAVQPAARAARGRPREVRRVARCAR